MISRFEPKLNCGTTEKRQPIKIELFFFRFKEIESKLFPKLHKECIMIVYYFYH